MYIKMCKIRKTGTKKLEENTDIEEEAKRKRLTSSRVDVPE